jgi:hypothetical protein
MVGVQLRKVGNLETTTRLFTSQSGILTIRPHSEMMPQYVLIWQIQGFGHCFGIIGTAFSGGVCRKAPLATTGWTRPAKFCYCRIA